MLKSGVVIRGDMIKSRKNKEKTAFWNKLDSVIADINDEFHEELVFKFEIFKGDELTGICLNIKEAYEIAAKIFEYISPLKIRLVISEGEIDQERKTERLQELDGEVFWKASEEMKLLKQSKRFISFRLVNEEISSLVSKMADLITELKYEWTETEKKIIKLYEEHNNQLIVAEKLDVTQQSISDGLRRAKYKIIREAEKALVDFL
jgi:hypothetical protein